MPRQETDTGARPALAPIPTNQTRKRAHSASEDAPAKASSISKPNKRVAFKVPETTTSSSAQEDNAQAGTVTKTAALRPIEKQPDWAFDVVGTWEIDATHISHDFQKPNYLTAHLGLEPQPVKSFILEIRYDNDTKRRKIGRQLWATFKWGDWSGCMRMCPGHEYSCSHEDFYHECDLGAGVWPGEAPLGTSVWTYRWRAQWPNGTVVDGTDEREAQLQFSRDQDGVMRIYGKMVAGSLKARKFSGVKISETVIELEKGLDHVNAWWKKLTSPYQESRRELCYSCKGKIDDSDESESEPPSEHDWEAENKEREAALAKEKAEEEAPWPSTMVGAWDITPKQKHLGDMDADKPDAVRYLRIFESCQKDGARRQYWAKFRFGQMWSGIMRLCPRPALKVRVDSGEDISVKDFEKACILEEGVNPGPPPHGVNEWYIKWRGPLDFQYETENDRPTDDGTTSFSVRKGEDGTLTLNGVMCKGVNVNFFSGVRTGDHTPQTYVPKFEQLWRERAFKKPRCYDWHSFLPDDLIHKPPKWAWDVLGTWRVDAPGFAVYFGHKMDTRLLLTIKMDNSKSNPSKVGRQLWAQFDFYTADYAKQLEEPAWGCMRFCPLAEGSRPFDDVEDFEKACKLKGGVWPGDIRSAKGKSFEAWGCRWRGTDTDNDSIPRSDLYETRVDFKMDDGRLTMGGLLAVDGNYIMMKGKQVARAVAPDEDEAQDTAIRFWEMHSPYPKFLF